MDGDDGPRVGVSAIGADDYRRRSQHLIANHIAFSDDSDDASDEFGVFGWRHSDGIVLDRIEHCAKSFEADDIQRGKLREELLTYEFDTSEQGLCRSFRIWLLRRIDGAIEVVDDVEHLDQDGALAAFDLERHVTPHPRPRLFELVGGSPMFDENRLQLLTRLRQLVLEVFAA